VAAANDDASVGMMVSFMYGGALSLHSIEDLCRLWAVADRYMVTALIGTIKKALKQWIDEELCFSPSFWEYTRPIYDLPAHITTHVREYLGYSVAICLPLMRFTLDFLKALEASEQLRIDIQQALKNWVHRTVCSCCELSNRIAFCSRCGEELDKLVISLDM
jgi:hypothetical protein